MKTKAKQPAAKKAVTPTGSRARLDVKGWELCPGDNVLIVSPGEEYHGLFGKVDAFPTTLELSSYVQIDGRPSTSGRVLLPNGQLRWMGPDEAHIDQHRPTRPGQRVRVVLDNEALATDEMKALEGKLGNVTELGPSSNGNSMMTVKFEDPELAKWPTAINNYDLLVVPIPVVAYVPEPAPAEQEQRITSGVGSMGSLSPEIAAKFKGKKPAAKAKYGEDADGHPIAVGDEVRYTHPTSIHSGGAGIITAIHEKEGNQEPIATVQLHKLSTWKTAPAIPAFLSNLTYLSTPPPVAAPEPEQTPAPVATDAPAEFRNIPLEEIHVSRNTRQIFDDTALAELAQSIKERGVIAPITVRPYLPVIVNSPLRYELVAGERRLRASKLAGLLEIPAMVRVLDDRAFIEVQLLENLQRQNVRPSDEAQAFAELLNKHKFSAEEIALKVGKPVKFVLQRAYLVKLLPFWFEALEQGTLALAAAHELARLPAHSQLVVKQHVDESGTRYHAGYSKSDIRFIIDSKITHSLDKAPWDLADALHISAGPCTTCSKRSLMQGVLFAEKQGEGLCLDGGCFASKRGAFVRRRALELEKEMGVEVPMVHSTWYPDEESKKLGAMKYGGFNLYDEPGNKRVPVLVVDGTDAGQLRYAHFYNDADAAKIDPAVAVQKKAEDAARIRKEREKKAERTLLAEKLTTDLAAGTTGPVGLAVLTYLLLDELGANRIPLMVELLGCAEPTEEERDTSWNKRDAAGITPYQHWLRRQLTPRTFTELQHLYFTVKVRHRMDHEYEDRQFVISSLLQGQGLGYEQMPQQAAEWVDNRYYSKKKGLAV